MMHVLGVRRKYFGPKGHPNIRILQTMVSGSPLVLGLKTRMVLMLSIIIITHSSTVFSIIFMIILLSSLLPLSLLLSE